MNFHNHICMIKLAQLKTFSLLSWNSKQQLLTCFPFQILCDSVGIICFSLNLFSFLLSALNYFCFKCELSIRFANCYCWCCLQIAESYIRKNLVARRERNSLNLFVILLFSFGHIVELRQKPVSGHFSSVLIMILDFFSPPIGAKYFGC